MRLRRLIWNTDNVDSQMHQHSILEFVLVEKERTSGVAIDGGVIERAE